MCTHVPTHIPMRWHMYAHPHTRTCLWPRLPSQLQAGCVSGAPARAALPGVGLASTSPPRLSGSPFVPACCGLGAPSQALLPAGSSAPSILSALLFLQNMRLEIPPQEACPLSLAGGEPPSLGSCVPLRDEPSSDLISAMGSCGQATSLSLCLWGGLPHSLPWKRAEGMGGPKGLVISILPSHTGCQCGHLCGWQLAEHSSASPRARPGLPNQQPLLVSILWRSWT